MTVRRIANRGPLRACAAALLAASAASACSTIPSVELPEVSDLRVTPSQDEPGPDWFEDRVDAEIDAARDPNTVRDTPSDLRSDAAWNAAVGELIERREALLAEPDIVDPPARSSAEEFRAEALARAGDTDG